MSEIGSSFTEEGGPYVDYGDFVDVWGVSRATFHGLTLGTLLIMFLIAITGYLAGSKVRSRDVVIPIEQEPSARPSA